MTEHRHHLASSRGQERVGRLRLAIVLNLAVVAVQVVFGFWSRSLGLLADAGHNVADVAAVLISLVAIRWSMRQPTERRSFGYHRGTILAALLNAMSIFVVTALIAVEAVKRLLHPHSVHGGVVVAVALAAAVVNGFAALTLHEGNEYSSSGAQLPRDVNIRSAMLHMASDAAVSVGVAAAGAVILATGRFYWLDPAASLVIGLLIALQALRIVGQAVNVLLESTPTDIALNELGAFMEQVDGVEAVHDLHVWSLSSELRAMSAHLVLEGNPSLRDSQVVGDRVRIAVRDHFAIAHATFELESDHCNDGEPSCAAGDALLAPGDWADANEQ